MHGHRNNATSSPEVVRFARAAQSAQGDNDQLDKAGQTILQLLNRAAVVAEENSRHAVEMAQKLLHQLRAAEDRVAELEATSPCNKSEPIARSSCSTKSIPRSRIAFWDRQSTPAAVHGDTNRGKAPARG